MKKRVVLTQELEIEITLEDNELQIEVTEEDGRYESHCFDITDKEYEKELGDILCAYVRGLISDRAEGIC